MATRNYTNTATEATLSASITSSATTAALTSDAGFPAAPFTAVIDRNTADEEVVLVTTYTAGSATLTRGYDGTTAKSHATGATFQHAVVARDFDEANDHVNASSNVHGIAGAVVGTTDTQTLTNKTLTSPALSAPTITGAATAADLTVTNSLTVPTPTVSGHAAPKTYVDTADSALDTRLDSAEATLAAATSGTGTTNTLVKRGTTGATNLTAVFLGPQDGSANAAARKDYVDAADNALDARLDTLEADTGWVNVAVNTPFTVGAEGCQIRKIGKRVSLAVHTVRTSAWAAEVILLTLAAQYRPTRTVWATRHDFAGSPITVGEVRITSDGAVTLVENGDKGTVFYVEWPI